MLELYPDILTTRQAAAALSIGKNTLYRLLADGTIPSFLVGRTIKIPKQGLLTYIESACYNHSYIARSLPERSVMHGREPN